MKEKSSFNSWMLVSIVIGILLFVMILTLGPKPIDWTQSYSKNDRIPFGNSILYNLLPPHFEGHEVETMHAGLSSFLTDSMPDKCNVIVINQDFSPDEKDQAKLFDVLEGGASVFIAASSFADELADTFHIEYSENFWQNFNAEDSISFNFANRRLKTGFGYWYKKGITNNYFTSYDTLKTTVLGFNNKGKTNFIRIRQGDGSLYINLNPLAFTNYNLLVQDNYEYIFKCLSYLPRQHTIWDEYYKRNHINQASSLDFILSRKPLRYAWYLLLISIAVFFIFQGRRTQRAIPVLHPPANTTLSFIETIGRLYFSRKNHLDIAGKRYVYFLEYLRTRYYVDTSDINDATIHLVVDKSGIPLRSIRQIFEIGRKITQVSQMSEADLEQFNRQIEYFYTHSR